MDTGGKVLVGFSVVAVLGIGGVIIYAATRPPAPPPGISSDTSSSGGAGVGASGDPNVAAGLGFATALVTTGGQIFGAVYQREREPAYGTSPQNAGSTGVSPQSSQPYYSSGIVR